MLAFSKEKKYCAPPTDDLKSLNFIKCYQRKQKYVAILKILYS